MPKTGTSSAMGVIVAAGCRASSQPQAANPKREFPHACHATAAQVATSACCMDAEIAFHPSIKSDSAISVNGAQLA